MNITPDLERSLRAWLADGPELIGQYSKDLAFELYTVPEPGSCLLLVTGLAGVFMLRRRDE